MLFCSVLCCAFVFVFLPVCLHPENQDLLNHRHVQGARNKKREREGRRERGREKQEERELLVLMLMMLMILVGNESSRKNIVN